MVKNSKVTVVDFRKVEKTQAGHAYDLIADEYDSCYEDAKSIAENKILRKLLIDGCYNRGKILDVGCGTGLFVDLFPGLPPGLYTGIDPSGKMLTKAMSKYPLYRKFRHGSFENLYSEVDHEYESLVSLFGGFNYVCDPKLAIDEIYRVPKPGGRIFLVTYTNQRVEDSYILDDVLKKSAHPPIERTLYTPHQLKSLFKSRFENITVRGMTNKLKAFKGKSVKLAWPAYLFGLAETKTAKSDSLDGYHYLILTATKRG